MLEKIVIEPKNKATASIIWLHGLGADGYDFKPIVEELNLSHPVRFIFPHAPVESITIYQGYEMRAWYDITSQNLLEKEDQIGIQKSEKQIAQLIELEIHQGIPSERIIIAGFSQGGAITLQTGLRFPQKLAGLLVLSSYLPLSNDISNEINKANRFTPMMMAHGMLDTIVPIDIAKQSRDILIKEKCRIEWHEYPMQHAVCPKEIKDIKKWLEKILG